MREAARQPLENPSRERFTFLRIWRVQFFAPEPCAAGSDCYVAALQPSALTIAADSRKTTASGEHGSDAAFARYFVPLIEKHGVQLVLGGHDHDYERTRPISGTTYVVTGGGGGGRTRAA